MISAEKVSLAGDRYLGTPYSSLDCQALVERCLADCGLRRNLKGSNAWWRQMTWRGTPEECRTAFGCIPRGAFLFILADDGGERARGYRDGLGNAAHMGLYTGRGEGAIHASASRGCVAESAFDGRTVPRGGWNRVGLWDQLDYGEAVNALLRAQAAPSGAAEKAPGLAPGDAVVAAKNGRAVNVRAKPAGAKQDTLPIGAAVTILETRDGWCLIDYHKQGWMMAQFLENRDEGVG